MDDRINDHKENHMDYLDHLEHLDHLASEHEATSLCERGNSLQPITFFFVCVAVYIDCPYFTVKIMVVAAILEDEVWKMSGGRECFWRIGVAFAFVVSALAGLSVKRRCRLFLGSWRADSAAARRFARGFFLFGFRAPQDQDVADALDRCAVQFGA